MTTTEPQRTMKLILQHASNPDIPGYWDAPVDKKLTMVAVADIHEARREFIAWRERNRLGGGNLTKRCGELWQDKNTLVGRFSYNGRFWLPDGSEMRLNPGDVLACEEDWNTVTA